MAEDYWKDYRKAVSITMISSPGVGVGATDTLATARVTGVAGAAGPGPSGD